MSQVYVREGVPVRYNVYYQSHRIGLSAFNQRGAERLNEILPVPNNRQIRGGPVKALNMIVNLPFPSSLKCAMVSEPDIPVEDVFGNLHFEETYHCPSDLHTSNDSRLQDEMSLPHPIE